MMDREKYNNEVQNHNRVHIGQIVGVRDDEGLMLVRVASGALHQMPVPLIGFSMPLLQSDGETTERSGFKSSWMRYMPQVGDFVKVAFGPDNRPEAIGAASWGDLPAQRGPQGQLGGYAQYSRARDRGVDGLDMFYRLRPGEWDMRSIGNAYIKGGRFGTLTLAGGGVQLQLRKEQEELRSRAGLYELDSTGATFVLGDVKRSLTGGFQPEQVTGSGKELDIDVSHQVLPSPAPANAYARVRAGDVRDAAGIIEVSGAASPVRFREEVFDGLPQTTQPTSYIREVDALGNIYETQGALATQHQINGSSIAEFSRTGYLRLNYAAATDITVDAARINLGATATEPVARGQQLVTALQALTVPTAFGPSGVPINAATFPTTLSTKVFTE